MWLKKYIHGILKWGDNMKIVKYKKKPNGKYSVFLDDDRELILYEDVILKYNLLISKCISEEELLDIYQCNLSYDVYYVALKSIKTRMKSVFELESFLKKKEYPVEFIEEAIKKLIEQGYLNDRSFAKSYVNYQIITTCHGPGRIKKELLAKKVALETINDEISFFSEDMQLEKIHKIIKAAIKSNRNRGGLVLKQKIVNDLKVQGFDADIINKALLDYSFDVDKDIAKKEYDKLYRKYSTKYEGYELKRIIREKMYQKGLIYEEE